MLAAGGRRRRVGGREGGGSLFNDFGDSSKPGGSRAWQVGSSRLRWAARRHLQRSWPAA